MRRTRVYIGSNVGNDELEKPRKIDALLITHRYDDEPLYITIPEIFEKNILGLGGGNETDLAKFFQ